MSDGVERFEARMREGMGDSFTPFVMGGMTAAYKIETGGNFDDFENWVAGKAKGGYFSNIMPIGGSDLDESISRVYGSLSEDLETTSEETDDMEKSEIFRDNPESQNPEERADEEYPVEIVEDGMEIRRPGAPEDGYVSGAGSHIPFEHGGEDESAPQEVNYELPDSDEHQDEEPRTDAPVNTETHPSTSGDEPPSGPEEPTEGPNAPTGNGGGNDYVADFIQKHKKALAIGGGALLGFAAIGTVMKTYDQNPSVDVNYELGDDNNLYFDGFAVDHDRSWFDNADKIREIHYEIIDPSGTLPTIKGEITRDGSGELFSSRVANFTKEISLAGLEGGIYEFHVKAIDDEKGWGEKNSFSTFLVIEEKEDKVVDDGDGAGNNTTNGSDGGSTPVTIVDNDGDGMDDNWESRYGVGDPNADPDGDGLTNLQEYQRGTDPLNYYDPKPSRPGSGGQQQPGQEPAPSSSSDPNADPDGDGYTNSEEEVLGSDPNNPNDPSSSNQSPQGGGQNEEGGSAG